MVRRVVTDDDERTGVVEERVVEHTPIATVIANVVTAIYTLAVAVIGLDTLFEALGARESNGFVSFVDTVSDPLLAPFTGMFDDQRYWATALVAALVYTLVYLVLMAVLRRDRAVRR